MTPRMPNLPHLSKRLEEARKSLCLTQDQVSKQTEGEIGLSSLSEFESGRRIPTLSQLEILSQIYRKPLSFFLDEKPDKVIELIRWRNEPVSSKKEHLEAEFKQLCRQYYNLEVWTNNKTVGSFKKLFATEPIKSLLQATQFADDTVKTMGLGDYPGVVLHKVLEEVYDVKIFYLDLEDDAISACFYDDELGPAILINRNKKRWRRNFDLAHELFHLLIWPMLEKDTNAKDEAEERLANSFAAAFLMPQDKVIAAIESARDSENRITFDKIDYIARLFDVSIEAFLWRLVSVYNLEKGRVKELKSELDAYSALREDTLADYYPKRYVSLANEALRNGDISTNRYLEYLKFLAPTRKQAEEIISANVPEPIEVPLSNP